MEKIIVLPEEHHRGGHFSPNGKGQICSVQTLKYTFTMYWPLGACSSKGRIVILGRIVLASGQIFRSDFRPQDEIFRPGMPFRPLDE